MSTWIYSNIIRKKEVWKLEFEHVFRFSFGICFKMGVSGVAEMANKSELNSN